MVEAGSMPYSAVSQPWPLFCRKGGTPSTQVAVHRTRVSPKEHSTEPGAVFRKRRSKRIGRRSLGARPSLRGMGFRSFGRTIVAAPPGDGSRYAPSSLEKLDGLRMLEGHASAGAVRQGELEAGESEGLQPARELARATADPHRAAGESAGAR